jgi:hypothetical protein
VLTDADLLHVPWLVMLASLSLVLALAWPARRLGRNQGLVLLACYPICLLILGLT